MTRVFAHGPGSGLRSPRSPAYLRQIRPRRTRWAFASSPSELNLSIGTVSRALNDRPDVNPETRARVKAAAAELGYVPNQSGRSLRSGRTGIVAAVIPTQGFAPSADAGLFTVLEGARRTLRAPGARPDRAVPRPGRGPAGEPAAYRAAAHRRRA